MKYLIPLSLAAMLLSCQPENKAPSQQEITAAAIEQGNITARQAQNALGGQLKKAIGEGGPVHAIQFCNTAAYPILDTLETAVPVKIKRAALRLRNPKDAPTEIERDILQTYLKNIKSGSPVEPVVRYVNEEQILYANPIILNNPICLNCHGAVGTQVAEETYQRILELYPEDDAINHKIGDLRGIWSITFQRDDLVNFMKENTSSDLR